MSDTPHEAADVGVRKLAAWMIRNSFATGHGDTLEDLLTELEWQVDDRAERLHRIRRWCEAYPIDVFPDQDLKRANEILKDAGISMSAMHGQWAREIMEGIAAIARVSLPPRGEGD